MIKKAKEYGINHTFIHFFSDGRDTAPKSTIGYLKTLIDFCNSEKYGKVATIVGRYYAMDRDNRWERIKIAYEGMVQGLGEHSTDPLATINARYEAGETDEFLKPIIVTKEGCVMDNDTLITFNFRSDRMRELVQALGVAPLPFESKVVPVGLEIVTMTQYKAEYPFKCIFPPQTMENVLAEWLGREKVTQCHIAETEKYAHVTFFFNGGTENCYPFEDRELVASPKVATYDLQPEMSAIEVAEKVVSVVETGKVSIQSNYDSMGWSCVTLPLLIWWDIPENTRQL